MAHNIVSFMITWSYNCSKVYMIGCMAYCYVTRFKDLFEDGLALRNFNIYNITQKANQVSCIANYLVTQSKRLRNKLSYNVMKRSIR